MKASFSHELVSDLSTPLFVTALDPKFEDSELEWDSKSIKEDASDVHRKFSFFRMPD